MRARDEEDVLVAAPDHVHVDDRRDAIERAPADARRSGGRPAVPASSASNATKSSDCRRRMRTEPPRGREQRRHARGIVVCAAIDLAVADAEMIVVSRDEHVAVALRRAAHHADQVGGVGKFLRAAARGPLERELLLEAAVERLEANLLELGRMNACARLLPGVPVSRPSISGADSDWTSRMRRSPSIRPVSRERADCAQGAVVVSTRTTAHHDARLNMRPIVALDPPSHFALPPSPEASADKTAGKPAFALGASAFAKGLRLRQRLRRTQPTRGQRTSGENGPAEADRPVPDASDRRRVATRYISRRSDGPTSREEPGPPGGCCCSRRPPRPRCCPLRRASWNPVWSTTHRCPIHRRSIRSLRPSGRRTAAGSHRPSGDRSSWAWRPLFPWHRRPSCRSHFRVSRRTRRSASHRSGWRDVRQDEPAGLGARTGRCCPGRGACCRAASGVTGRLQTARHGHRLRRRRRAFARRLRGRRGTSGGGRLLRTHTNRERSAQHRPKHQLTLHARPPQRLLCS